MTELEEAWLIRSLHREEGWPQVEIARWFGRHKSWVNRRLLLAEGLADEVQADPPARGARGFAAGAGRAGRHAGMRHENRRRTWISIA